MLVLWTNKASFKILLRFLIFCKIYVNIILLTDLNSNYKNRLSMKENVNDYFGRETELTGFYNETVPLFPSSTILVFLKY